MGLQRSCFDLAGRGLGVAIMVAVLAATASAQSPRHTLRVTQDDGVWRLALDDCAPFHETTGAVENARLVEAARADAGEDVLLLWDESSAEGRRPFYGISLGGQDVQRVTDTSYRLMLRYGEFDPVADAAPAVPEGLRTPLGSELYIMQFVTQPLESFEARVTAAGASVLHYLPYHAYLVRMVPETAAAVRALPFVRWVGRHEPAYRLEEWILEHLAAGDLPIRDYNILVFERGLRQQEEVRAVVERLGGAVHFMDPHGMRMVATLTPAAVRAVARLDCVQFADRWGEPRPFMDNARAIGGVETLFALGYRGVNVVGEVMDVGRLFPHPDFSSRITAYHYGIIDYPYSDHPTASFGIIFGGGELDGGSSQARGVLPEGFGLFCAGSMR